jgi:NAD(P)-dependent dehydrogenase (short-subunit alcohol dehydrogenase family)
MTRFTPTSNPAQYLKGKIVVLTGGSTGIGAATVSFLASCGASVIFGDIAPPLDGSTSHNVDFVKCDVRSYADNLALFKYAFDKYGRIDHALANAGLVERAGWVNAQSGIQAVEKEPDISVLDVNLKGVLYFAHIACAYLAEGNEMVEDKSLTLISSVAGFKESPGLFVYQASKHGDLGLMRALRLFAPKVYKGPRVNAVCPSMTETGMVAGIRDGWISARLPVNTPNDLARVLVGIMAAGTKGGSGISDEKDVKGKGNSTGAQRCQLSNP